MNRVNYKSHRAAFIPAAVFAVLVCLTLFFAAPGIGGARADAETGDEALIVLENSTQSRWSQLSKLNVFDTTDGGQSIIAPGSSGEYGFTIQNSAKFPLKYTLKISDENEAGVPMEFRLKRDNAYVVGNENEWADISALSEITDDLSHESEAAYTLEWYWPGDKDELDTAAGAAAQDNGKYVLNFGVTAEQSGDPDNPDDPNKPPETGDPDNPDDPNKPPETGDPDNPDDPNKPPQTGDTGNSDNTGSTPKTGDMLDMSLWLTLAIASAILFVLFVPMRRRGKNEEETENA